MLWKIIIRMAQEDQNKRSNDNGNGRGDGDGGICIGNFGRPSRKQKQMKIPQRGLGVAQLEKIRLEEQQKKDVSANLTSLAPISKTTSSSLSTPIPNYDSCSSSIPYPPDLSSANSIFMAQNIDLVNSNNAPLGNSLECRQTATVKAHRNLPIACNSSDYNLGKENCWSDPGLAFWSDLNLPNESNPSWPLPSLTQGAQHFRQPSSSSCSMVISASTGCASSSLLHFQMEPPSNQSYCDNYTYNLPACIDKEKMLGMKRPYPFSLDSSPGGFSHYKCPFTSKPALDRSDESASFFNGGMYNFSFINPNYRDGSSCSTSILELSNAKKSIKENGACNGDFLTLAPPLPPSTTMTSNSLKLKPSAYLAFHNIDAFDFDSLPYQDNVEDTNQQQPVGLILPDQQQPYYCFLPPALMQNGQSAKAINNCRSGSEVGENIDLNLKL